MNFGHAKMGDMVMYAKSSLIAALFLTPLTASAQGSTDQQEWTPEASLSLSYDSDLGEGIGLGLAARKPIWSSGPWSSSVALGGEVQYFPDSNPARNVRLSDTFIGSASAQPRVSYNFENNVSFLFLEGQIGAQYQHSTVDDAFQSRQLNSFKPLVGIQSGVGFNLTKTSALQIGVGASNQGNLDY